MFRETRLNRNFWLCAKVLFISLLYCSTSWATDSLPFLSSGNAVATSGDFTTTNTQFFGGVSVGNEFVTSATIPTSDNYSTVKFTINVDPDDVGEQADLLVVLGEDNQLPYDGGSDTNYFAMVNEGSSFVPLNLYATPEVWMAQLMANPFYTNSALQNQMPIEFGLNSTTSKMLYVFAGYRLRYTGKIVYSAKPVMLYVDKELGITQDIQILSATYGGNCGNLVQGNTDVTAHISSSCNGKKTCYYNVNSIEIGDPAYGCKKSYEVRYTCGDVNQVETALIEPEANRNAVYLSCNELPTVTIPIVSNVTDSDTNLGIVIANPNNKEIVTIYGEKDIQGNLVAITDIARTFNEEDGNVTSYRSINFNFGNDIVSPQLSMEFSNGQKVEIRDYDANTKEGTIVFTDTNGQIIEVRQQSVELPSPAALSQNDCFKELDCVKKFALGTINKMMELFCAAGSGGWIADILIRVSDFIGKSYGHEGTFCKPFAGNEIPEIGLSASCYMAPIEKLGLLSDITQVAGGMWTTRCKVPLTLQCIEGTYGLSKSIYEKLTSGQEKCKNSCKVQKTSTAPKGCWCESHEGVIELANPTNFPINGGFKERGIPDVLFLTRITYCTDPECGRATGITNYTETETWVCD